MAASSHNHTNFRSRLEYIRRLLQLCLGFSAKDVEQTNITPIQYDLDCPFKYNNFVYLLSLPSGAILRDGHDETQTNQPGCVLIPTDTKRLILRLSNPDAEGMHPETRVQNEVAILSLASQALGHIEPNVVPRVFGWGAARHDHFGWILQDYSLPDSIQGWGGVTYDDSGAIASAPMTSVGSGPWSSLEDSYRCRLETALAKAGANPHLQSWRPNGVRDRIDAFIERGLPKQFSHLTSKRERAIIHADFTPDNLLYDPATGRITALLDYDFASILHPGYEFFRSFATNGGRLLGWSADHEAAAIRNAKLTGQFPSPLPTQGSSTNGPGVDWELALAWEHELQRLQVKRPSTISGIEELADMDEVLGSLLPWRLTNEDFLKMNQDEGQRMALRCMAETHLVGLLEHMGF